MNYTKPLYFFAVHIHLYHNLLSQRVLELARASFLRQGNDFKFTLLPINDGYTLLLTESTQPVPDGTIKRFEDLISNEPLILMVGGSTTYDLDKSTVPQPTLLFTLYATNDFSKLSTYFGEGVKVYKRLKKHLEAIPVGWYFLEYISGHIVLFLESKTPFNQEDLDKIPKILSNAKIKIRNQHQNF